MPNRSIGSYFGANPVIKGKRSILPLSFKHTTTFNAGKLVPIFVEEVLPGDTWSLNENEVIRLTTSLHPTMDYLIADTYYFFVPNRLIWDDFTKFMGENDEAWAQDTSKFIPPYWSYDSEDADEVEPGSLFNHLGLPVGFNGLANDGSFRVTGLDLNAYIKIWNDWFRDENVQDECPFYKVSGRFDLTFYSNYYYSAFGVSKALYSNDSCLPVNKLEDYFTSVLPQPQKGNSVVLPGTSGSIYYDSDGLDSSKNPRFYDLDTPTATVSGKIQENPSGTAKIYSDADTSARLGYDPAGTLAYSGFEITVNALRLAIKTQELLEIDARGGTRYTSLIYSHFGVVSPDARLQRSEYLGGSRFNINMTEVVQQSMSSGTHYLGDLAGRSLTFNKNGSTFTKSFTEHGYIIGVICIRSHHSYSQGIPKRYTRFNRLDYYWRVLANIGEQPIYNYEIFYSNSLNLSVLNGVFGYNEAWADYRYHPDRQSGFFAPMSSNSLMSWTYCDYYTSLPYYSSSWMIQGKSEVDRTLTVQSSSTVPQFMCDCYFSGKVTRKMPLFSIPGSTRL